MVICYHTLPFQVTHDQVPFCIAVFYDVKPCIHMRGYAGLYGVSNGNKHGHNGDTLLYMLIELSEPMFLSPGQYFHSKILAVPAY